MSDCLLKNKKILFTFFQSEKKLRVIKESKCRVSIVWSVYVITVCTVTGSFVKVYNLRSAISTNKIFIFYFFKLKFIKKI